MKKRIIPFILICALLLAVAVSCNNNPGGGGNVQPTRTATLALGYFKEYYARGASENELAGSLYYTDTKGNITTIPITKDGKVTEGLTVEGFESGSTGEKKTVTFSYKGTFCTGQYSIVELKKIDIDGTFIFDTNTTYTFTYGSDEIVKEKYAGWNEYLNFESAHPLVETLKYETVLNSSGKTVIKIAGDSWSYSPDGEGGILYKPSDSAYFAIENNKYMPDGEYFYVSTGKEDSRSSAETKNKYLIIGFNYVTEPAGDMYMWFVDNLNDTTFTNLDYDNPDLKVPVSCFSFGTAGVELPKQNVGDIDQKPAGKNLNLVLNKYGYDSKEMAFTVISHSDGNYRGYSYCMKLSDVETSWSL